MNPAAFELSLAEATAYLNALCINSAQSACPVIDIDIRQPDWSQRLAMFLTGTFEDLPTTAAGLASSLAGSWPQSPEPHPSVSLQAFRNGDYLRLIGEQNRKAGPAQLRPGSADAGFQLPRTDRDD